MTPADTGRVEVFTRHAELYGPESVVETAKQDHARRELTEHQLGEIVAWLAWKERTHRWKESQREGSGWSAGRWEQRPGIGRACEGCGLELPSSSSNRRRYHSAGCRQRAYVTRSTR